jgi:hypothetical protein
MYNQPEGSIVLLPPSAGVQTSWSLPGPGAIKSVDLYYTEENMGMDPHHVLRIMTIYSLGHRMHVDRLYPSGNRLGNPRKNDRLAEHRITKDIPNL